MKTAFRIEVKSAKTILFAAYYKRLNSWNLVAFLISTHFPFCGHASH